MSPIEFILRFTFTNPDLDTTIVGTISSAHLQTGYVRAVILGSEERQPLMDDDSSK